MWLKRMSSPLIKISDESWSLVCLCCSCAQEVRDLIKMSIGPAFVEYNHRFTCPNCQTYNQIMLSRDMFDNAQVMVFQAPPPAPGGQNAPPFDPNEFSQYSQNNEAPAKSPFSFDFDAAANNPAPTTESNNPTETYKPSMPSFEAATENKPPAPSITPASRPGIIPPPPARKPDNAPDNTSLDDIFGKKGKKGKADKEVAPAAEGTIKIFGKDIPLNNQTKLAAGGGALVIVVVLYFFVFSGSPPPQTANATPSPSPSASPSPKGGKTASPTPVIPDLPKYPIVEAKMVEIPAGEYAIGSGQGTDKERPEHKVEVKAFLIDNREVTKEEYAKFVKEAKYKAPATWNNGNYLGNGQEPITDVTLEDAKAYAKWAGKRLPTEIEWEVAAGGKDHTIYPWGNDWDVTKANTKEATQDGPKPAGAFMKGVNPFGLYDMAGNVWEWTDSVPQPYPNSSFKVDDAQSYRVIRGGAYKEGKAVATTFARNWIDPSRSDGSLGFRCAKDKE